MCGIAEDPVCPAPKGSSTSRTSVFCNALISHNIDILWHIRTRIDLIDKVLGEKLLKAGCKRISFGIESASYKILKIIKKEIDLDEVRKKIFLLKSIGFEIYLDFMKNKMYIIREITTKIYGE